MNSLIYAIELFRRSSRDSRDSLLRVISWFTLIALILYVIFADAAWAAQSQPIGGQVGDFSLFDSLDTDANNQSKTWFSTILGMVRPTFLILATIEICWAAAIWAIEKDNLNSLAVEIIKKIMVLGFFFALLQFAPVWIPTITQTFRQVGETAANTGPVTTDSIIATGIALIKLVWSKAPTGLFGVLGKLGEILVACFVTLGIVICYVVLAAQYFTLMIESYILFAAGAIFLGLGASSWTKDYVSKYLNYAITVGVRLLVLILILSLLLSTIDQMAQGFRFEFEPLLKLLAVTILQAILGIKAPEMAGALLSGGIGMSAGGASSAAGAGIGGFKTAVASVASVASKGASAVQGSANLGKAVAAGQSAAAQQGKSGLSGALSGLGMTGREMMKQTPGAVKSALKGAAGAGKGGASGSGGSGLFDKTKQALEARAGKNPGGGSNNSAGGGGGGLSITVPAGTPIILAGNSSTPGAGAGGNSNTNAGSSGGPNKLKKAAPRGSGSPRSSGDSSAGNS